MPKPRWRPSRLSHALAKSDDGAGTLEVFERFDRAWRRVGLALTASAFTVEDRDRSRACISSVMLTPSRQPQQEGPA